MQIATNKHPELVARTRRELLICLAVFSNLLIASTWRLWIPPLRMTWSAEFCPFPRVPLVFAVGRWPPVMDYVLLGVMIVGSWGLLASSKRIQLIAPWVFLLGSVALMLGNQHRIQPWLYQISTLCLMATVLSSGAWIRFARWHMISIYLFSAWSKLDYTFVHSLGQQFLNVVLSPRILADANEVSRQCLALCFPVAELLIGLGLIWSRTRYFAAVAAVVLHVMLIGILGPWGLNHHLGVLLWNTQFIAMLAVLFLVRRDPEPTDQPAFVWKRYLAWTILLLPALEPFGLWDHWPSWQLYAPRNSRVALHILQGAPRADALPAAVRPYITHDDTSVYQHVSLDSWSLDSLNVPIYPQDRFQLGVAIAFIQQAGIHGSARITIESTANRWTGQRQQVILRGTDEIKQATSRFRFNALPLRISQ